MNHVTGKCVRMNNTKRENGSYLERESGVWAPGRILAWRGGLSGEGEGSRDDEAGVLCRDGPGISTAIAGGVGAERESASVFTGGGTRGEPVWLAALGGDGGTGDRGLDGCMCGVAVDLKRKQNSLARSLR